MTSSVVLSLSLSFGQPYRLHVGADIGKHHYGLRSALDDCALLDELDRHVRDVEQGEVAFLAVHAQ